MLVGLIVGIAIGLLLGPALRSWVVWREHVEADREARLHEEILRRLAPPAGDPSRPGHPLRG
ncbi:MAG TPA: hypothetical protein VE962_05865 [Actinomycetota bacterium]|jgi:hypothetical protein|nr:hypothetical protein [Actinomycetota bacterium]